MAKAKKVEVEVLEDEIEVLEDEAELDDIDNASDNDEEVEGLSAKEAAHRLGTDGRTFRKFLRNKFGLVGQGKRWVILEEDMDDLTAEFHSWHKPRPKGEAVTSKMKKEKVMVAFKAPIEKKKVEDYEEIEDLTDDDFEDEGI